MLFRVYLYSDFMVVNAENTDSHKYIVYNDRSICRPIS